MNTPASQVRLAGIIGFPLGHTVSPAMQQAAFDHHGLAVRYVVWETPAEGLRERIASLRRAAVLGANVTVPHKQAVMALVDEVGEDAAAVGAVNTVVNRDGRLYGYNTDVPGFLRALREDGGFEPRGSTALLLGAGGAARGVVHALVKAGVRRLTIANRRLERAVALATELELSSEAPVVATIPWQPEALASTARAADLIVNATTIGMLHDAAEKASPLPDEAFQPSTLAFDLVYNPQETPFLRLARVAGARTIGGLPMLVYQGAESFEIWTGLPAPVAVMRAAAQQSLDSMRR